MVLEDEDFRQEIREIKLTLSEMQNDLRRFMEHSNREHLESILSDFRKDFSDTVVAHLFQDIEEGLQNGMVKGCQMRETCKSLFSDLLYRNATFFREERVSEDSAQENVSSLKEMHENAPYHRCEKCFTEVERLLDSQVAIMHSLKIYQVERPEKDSLMVLPEETVVKYILEPLANRQRLQILKALSGATNTFSGLSQLTGLRGGNLLFHLSKLLGCGMILQRSGRGDYMITERGYTALKGITEIHSLLNDSELTATALQQEDHS